MAVERSIVSKERVVSVMNGWLVLLPLIAVMIADVAYVTSMANGRPENLRLVMCLVVLGLGVFGFVGLFSLQPNEARVLTLFGAYKGTVRASGFWWANPLYGGGRQGFGGSGLASRQLRMQPASAAAAGLAMRRMKVSLRARTLNGEPLKVNDKRGNPIEIAAVVVWRIDDTAQAFFDVDDYEHYVPIQSESALRHIANMYSYDDGEGVETTLRNNPDEVSEALRAELQARLAKAGVVVDEARLTHLAYAPEIAQVMLRRQQAEAVIAARQKIVQGAVGMVEMALTELSARGFVSLDDERKAAMVSNLMVVLCSESEVHPVVNTGTLYS
jgi:regulator of protease activity HflC (stomatin/prohibitin superfamily)